MTAAEPLRQEGYEQGYKQGYEIGYREGQRIACEALEERFGPLPESVVQRVSSAEPGQIDAWLWKVLLVASVEELFAPMTRT